MIDEDWMNVPIVFPPMRTRDLSEEAIMVEAEIEGYLVRRIHVDEGASLEIMYEHCFNMIHPTIKSRLIETHTTVSGFSGEQVKPLGMYVFERRFCAEGIMKSQELGKTSDRTVRASKAAGEYGPNGGSIGQSDLSRSASHNRQKIISGRFHPTKKSPQKKQRRFRMGTFRYDWGTKKNHQTHPQCQPVGHASQAKKKSVLLREKPSGNSGGGRVAKSRDSQTGKIPHMISEP
ncbi:hypothetical protein Tco_1299677 [Tanacetum coccineum]